MKNYICRIIDPNGKEYGCPVIAINEADACNFFHNGGYTVISIKEMKMAKKKPANKLSKAFNKKAPDKIKRNCYISMTQKDLDSLADSVDPNSDIRVSSQTPEKEIIEQVKKRIETKEDVDTIYIFQLVKKVTSSQEVKVQDMK